MSQNISFRSFNVAGNPYRPQLVVAIDDDVDDIVTNYIRNGQLWSLDHVQTMHRIIQHGTVLDIGAHIGTFSLMAGFLGFRVYGIEASPKNYNVFKAAVEKNSFFSVFPINCLVSDKQEEVRFEDNGPYGHVDDGSIPDERIVVVRSKSITDILRENGETHIDFIKLDVEGYELKVINGMSEILSAENGPPIIVESNGHTLNFVKETPNTLFRLLETFGYKVFGIFGSNLLPVDSSKAFPFCVCDCLCMKPYHNDKLRGFNVTQQLTDTQIKDIFEGNYKNANEDCRNYFDRIKGFLPK